MQSWAQPWALTKKRRCQGEQTLKAEAAWRDRKREERPPCFPAHCASLVTPTTLAATLRCLVCRTSASIGHPPHLLPPISQIVDQNRQLVGGERALRTLTEKKKNQNEKRTLMAGGEEETL